MLPAHKPASPVSLYFKVMLELREKMLSGEWPPGAQIPTEVDLVRTMGVSLITVRQALGHLVQEGYIRRMRAKGSFVGPAVPRRQSLQLRVEVDDLVHVQPQTKFKLESAAVQSPSRLIQAKLGLKDGASVTRIARVRMQDNHPLGYIVSHLPSRWAGKIPRKMLARLALAHLLETYAAIGITEVKHTVGAVLADSDASARLEISSGDPLLLIERDYISRGQVVAVSTGYYRSDLYRYELKLKRRAESKDPKGEK